MSLYAFHLGQIISTVLGQVDHGGQDGNAARTRIWDEPSETDYTQKRRCSALKNDLPNHKSFGYSEVLIRFRDGTIRVVIRKCETPITNISQENGNGMVMITCQIVAYN